MPLGPREGRILHAMSIDDAYEVQRVLSEGPNGRTEVVTIDEVGPYLRKRIPVARADRKVWAALEECASPRLPHVEATYTTPDEFIVVSNFVPADTLEEVVATESSLAPSEAVRIALEVCEAVDDLHRRGIVHCDIAPRNVLLAADGAHVVDLGNACQVGREFSAKEHPRGTWGFAAPEQYGFAPIDERTDVYAVGRLLGYLLTGVEPDDERYKVALADGDCVPASLREVVDRASAFEPSSRYQTAADLAEAIKAAMWGDGGDRVPAGCKEGPATNASGTWKRKRSKGRNSSDVSTPQMIVGMAGIVLMLVVAMVAFLSLASMGFDVAADVVHEKLSQTEVKDAKAPSSSNGDKAPDESAEDHQPAVNSLSMMGGEGAAKIDESEQAAAQDVVAAYEALSIVESAWFVKAGGYISYTFALHNDSADLTVEFPTVDIVGRDESGNIISSDYMVRSVVGPGETIYFASEAGNGTAPHSVDFSLRKPEAYNVERTRKERASFRVSYVSETFDEDGKSLFVGEVGLEKGVPSSGQIAVTVVLRDEQGAMVGGSTTYAGAPGKNASTTFETMAGTFPRHASIEAYVEED